MRRSLAAAVAAVAVLGAAGCSSLNPFGGGEDKPSAAQGDKSAAAEPAKAKRAPDSASLGRFDANGDTMVASQEVELGLQADFKAADKNGDEALDVGEARVLNDRLRREEASSPVFDWNADGKIVYTEFASQWRTLFQRSDIDGDGFVDEAELKGKRREYKPRDLPKPTFSGKDGRPPGSP